MLLVSSMVKGGDVKELNFRVVMSGISRRDVRMNLLFPACGRRPWSGDYKMPFVWVCVRPCVRSSRFYINHNIAFIYKDIFTKFAGNVYGYENLYKILASF